MTAIKTVIVTGAASGIGAATVKRYLDTLSVHVIAIDKNAEGLLALQQSFSPEQQQALQCLPLDLVDEASTQACLDKVLQGKTVDHIVISHAIGIENSISDHTSWDQVLSVNVFSVQRLLALLDAKINDGGRVVIVSSILGRVGKIANTAYVTSKHALLGLTKALALDWACRKITVNAVLPCWVDTPMLHQELDAQAKLMGVPTKQLLRNIKKRIPLKKLISADDVTDSILFLTSPAAKMITAQSIVVDGGFGGGV